MFTHPTEKREHLRFDSRIPMRYRRIETNIQEFKGSLMRNISEGGLMMSIYEFLPLNSKLAMEIPLVPGKRPIQEVCRVAWIAKAAFGEQYRVGAEFLNLNQAEGEQIAGFIFDKSVEGIL
jgi:c-di-GMP-binding flagellar brake protein YcgR